MKTPNTSIFKTLCMACFALSGLLINAQVAVDPRTEEYATVRAVISRDHATFSGTVTPNPVLEIEGMSSELKDYVKDSRGGKFATVTDMVNYMNKFSWMLLTVTAVDLKNSPADVMMHYTFKRKPKNKN